jgi:ribonuclease P protein component
MPAHYRLSRNDFTRMRGFKRVHGTLFSLSFGTLPERSVPGAACVVSAKVAPRAVARNRIKRRVRAILGPLMSNLPSPLILVLIAKKPAADASPAESREEVILLLRKAGITLERLAG